MKIAVALTCLMALATLGGVTGSSEQELDGEIQSQSIDAFNTFQESRVDPQLRKRACKKSLGGKCIKRRRDCPNNLPLETKPGGPYCNKRRRCCYPGTGCLSPWFTIGSGGVGGDDQCFLVVVEELDWASARANCLAAGADLAQPRDLKALAVNMAYNGYGNWYWLGVTDIPIEGEWRWLNETLINRNQWSPGQPGGVGDQDCANIWPKQRTGGLGDAPCDLIGRSVCGK